MKVNIDLTLPQGLMLIQRRIKLSGNVSLLVGKLFETIN